MRWPRKQHVTEPQKVRPDNPLNTVSIRLKTCEEALQKNPDDADALFTKAIFLARIHEYKRSVDCLQRVVSLQPEYPMAWGMLSLVYTRMGDYQNAKECHQKSVELED